MDYGYKCCKDRTRRWECHAKDHPMQRQKKYVFLGKAGKKVWNGATPDMRSSIILITFLEIEKFIEPIEFMSADTKIVGYQKFTFLLVPRVFRSEKSTSFNEAPKIKNIKKLATNSDEILNSFGSCREEHGRAPFNGDKLHGRAKETAEKEGSNELKAKA